MNAIDAIKEALESLEYDADWEAKKDYGVRSAISALRQALADTGIDRGAWADVPDATKWVDELRGDDDLEEPPNSTTDVVEPVAWIVPDYGFLFPNEDSAQRYLDNTESGAKPTPLYTAPPQREWVGLTDEDYKALEIETLVSNMGYREVLRWADKRLKEKNHVD